MSEITRKMYLSDNVENKSIQFRNHVTILMTEIKSQSSAVRLRMLVEALQMAARVIVK